MGRVKRIPGSCTSFCSKGLSNLHAVSKNPGAQGFARRPSLRLEVRTSRELGDLPLITLSAPYQTIRPSDVLVTKAAGFAGGSSFTEVLDIESVRHLADPLREEAVRLLRQHGDEIGNA